jgi:hypothetical protein
MAENNMSVADAAEASVPSNKLDQFAVEIDNGLEDIAKGMFRCAGALHQARELIVKSTKTEADRKKQWDAFLGKTNIANDASTQSKLQRIADCYPILQKYKDNIPQNFTAAYMIASNEAFRAKIEMHVQAQSDKKRLTSNLTTKQLRALMDTGKIDGKLEGTTNAPMFFNVRLGNKDLAAKLHEHWDEIQDDVREIVTKHIGGGADELVFGAPKALLEPKNKKKAS